MGYRNSTRSSLSASCVIESYKTNCFQCHFNPLSKRGRISQALGLVLLPLVSGIALSLYTSVVLADRIQACNHAKKLSSAVDMALHTVSAVRSMREGVSLMSVEVTTNMTGLFGSLDDHFDDALHHAKGISEWPGE